MTKKAFLVLGPESSGTRLMTKLFIDAGCLGDGEHEQKLDNPDDVSRELLNAQALPPDDQPVVWRRSIPHAQAWVKIQTLVEQLKTYGYEVIAVVTTRDWFATIKSQVKEGRVRSEKEALANIRKAYIHIFSGLDGSGAQYLVVSYEALAAHKEKAVRKVLEMAGLVKPRLVNAIEDGNAKWYAS